jgi:hypothetical protein
MIDRCIRSRSLLTDISHAESARIHNRLIMCDCNADRRDVGAGSQSFEEILELGER